MQKGGCVITRRRPKKVLKLGRGDRTQAVDSVVPCRMDSQFIPKAIDMVKDAIAADNNQDYEVALGLYKKSLEYFMTGLKYENNPVRPSFCCFLPPLMISKMSSTDDAEQG